MDDINIELSIRWPISELLSMSDAVYDIKIALYVNSSVVVSVGFFANVAVDLSTGFDPSLFDVHNPIGLNNWSEHGHALLKKFQKANHGHIGCLP